MDFADHSLFLVAAILAGAALQQIPILLARRGNRRAAFRVRWLVAGYWLAFGVILIVEGVGRLSGIDRLTGVSLLAFGLGILLSGPAQALGWAWLRVAGVAIIAVGPVAVGVQFIRAGNGLNGLIALSLGLGILISVARGWVGGIGQIVVGALLMGSGSMLLIEALALRTAPLDTTTATIGVALIVLSLWGIIGGAMTLIHAAGSPRRDASMVSEITSA